MKLYLFEAKPPHEKLLQMFSTEIPQPLFSRVHLHLIILKFGDVGRMTQNQVSKHNEVCWVTLLQLCPLLARKSRELRKGEWSSFNRSENSNEGLESPQDLHLSPLLVGDSWFAMNYYAAKRPSTYHCIWEINFRMVIHIPNQGLSVLLLLILEYFEYNTSSTHLNLSLLTYNEQ